MSFKQTAYAHCLGLLDDKIKSLRTILAELEEGSQSDSKSSAGDKHETARAMMQLEQEKIARQLQEVLAQKAELEKIDISTSSSEIKKGSLVKTNKGYLFISASIGKTSIKGVTLMCISAHSPLAAILLGLKENAVVSFNGASYEIGKIE
jgi:transcription elongation GreA/GreB family factor